MARDSISERASSIAARTLVAKLGGSWKGSYGTVLCPVHDDQDPSLTISEGKDGRILWHCHAGCSQEEVAKALKERSLLDNCMVSSGLRSKGSQISATYDYVGADGQLLFQVVRRHPKGFSQRRPDGKGSWIWNLKSVTPVVYRLPALLQSRGELIFIVEGEKDADRLAEIGLTATCNPGGAGKWREDYAQYFRGKEVIILPDNDPAGHKHGKAIAASLQRIARQVKIVHLPGLASKGDVSDWIAVGGDRTELLRICGETPAWSGGIGNWYAEAQTGARGQVLCNHANAMLALRHDLAWQGIFGYDEMRNQIMLHRPVPRAGQPPAPPLPQPEPWSDESDAQAQEYLQLVGLPSIGKEVVATAVQQRAGELRYHPLRGHLNGLQWDQIPRIRGGLTPEGDFLEPFLATYFGAENNTYTRTVGIMVLVSLVARVMQPGCKVDHVLILEGAQGTGKSTSLRILAGEAYFSDYLPEIGSKDAMDHLRGKWIVEIAELDAMSRAEDTALKAFVTRQVDRFRPAYGRHEIEYPRQCVFVGTTNKSNYLKDETGGRRFWPVACGSIDLTALKHDRDQILAEAMQLHRDGQPWHITDPELLRQAEDEQEARFDADVWEDTIAGFLSNKGRVTVSEVMRDLLGIQTACQDRAGQNRVVKILLRLGWRRDGRAPGGRTAWVTKSGGRE